ncbi:hypothetical protein ACFLT2_05710 [Acidobacteriota bacterium]
MVHILIGAVAMLSFLAVVNYVRIRKLSVRWWKWGLTVLGFLYAVFVLEMITSFLQEGAPRAALVMGIILGFIAVVWGVLLARFVFARKAKS